MVKCKRRKGPSKISRETEKLENCKGEKIDAWMKPIGFICRTIYRMDEKFAVMESYKECNKEYKRTVTCNIYKWETVGRLTKHC